MFRIKICGLTHPEQVAPIAAAGADALGLNFYPASKRYLTKQQDHAIARLIPAAVQRVGVFVNDEPSEILDRVTRCELTAVQLHGDETPEYCQALQQQLQQLAQPVRLIRALRLQSDAERELTSYLQACTALQVTLAMLLVDAFAPGEYGGTGRTADWLTLGAWTARQQTKLVVAGGLHAGNVAQAIRQSRADAVDTASGVERAPGDKDITLVEQFVTAARTAFAATA